MSAHASCGVDRSGEQLDLLEGADRDSPYDKGFHADLNDGSPADALRAVMREALEYIAEHNRTYVLDVTDRMTGETVRLYGEQVRPFNQPQKPVAEGAREI